MLFSSMIFLWLFLPFVLIVNLILPHRISNWFLMAASFIFYAWGEQEYIWLLLVSLLVNFYGAHILGCVGSPAQSLGCLSQSHVSQRHVFQNIRPFFFALPELDSYLNITHDIILYIMLFTCIIEHARKNRFNILPFPRR